MECGCKHLENKTYTNRDLWLAKIMDFLFELKKWMLNFICKSVWYFGSEGAKPHPSCTIQFWTLYHWSSPNCLGWHESSQFTQFHPTPPPPNLPSHDTCHYGLKRRGWFQSDCQTTHRNRMCWSVWTYNQCQSWGSNSGHSGESHCAAWTSLFFTAVRATVLTIVLPGHPLFFTAVRVTVLTIVLSGHSLFIVLPGHLLFFFGVFLYKAELF